MPATGIFVGGAAGLISGAVSADLGQNPDIENKDAALATVTGIIDGTGSLGAAIGQLVLGALVDINWYLPFIFLIGVAIGGISFILPMTLSDIEKIRNERKKN